MWKSLLVIDLLQVDVVSNPSTLRACTLVSSKVNGARSVQLGNKSDSCCYLLGQYLILICPIIRTRPKLELNQTASPLNREEGERKEMNRAKFTCLRSMGDFRSLPLPSGCAPSKEEEEEKCVPERTIGR